LHLYLNLLYDPSVRGPGPVRIVPARDPERLLGLEQIPPKPASSPREGELPPARVVTSDALLGSPGRLLILHNGERYTLRITANNKLILTK